ncbi:MAG: class I SAM-dependent methyltransferase [Acidobacteriota bacterium]|nr:class I SAM-dependent methyltransferase [Acidobacteriota bacterium]
MASEASRPFYDEYAWAYDMILAPVASDRCLHIAELLSQRGILSGARVLDAGCGTGGHAIELARLGFAVTGLDLSSSLLAEASGRTAEAALPVSLLRGDILALPFARVFDAILCRGVLNDLVDDESRRKVFVSFAGALRRGGVFIFDVREWLGTVKRKGREPVFEKSIETPRGRLTFRSETRLDTAGHKLLVTERHVLKKDGREAVSDYDFVMRCWTEDELQHHLTAAAFVDISFMGDYADGIPAGTSDRLICVATRA